MIHCDGAGWNGEVSKVCINKKEEDPIVKEFKTNLTNNEAEYLAVLDSIAIAEERETIKTDSQLVVKQCSGEWRRKASNLKYLHEAAVNEINKKNIDLEWIPREKNKAGKILEGKKN